jgi:hypothetical protein
VNLEEVVAGTVDRLERKAPRVDADGAGRIDDQHVPDLRQFAADAACFQGRQIVPVGPRTAHAGDVQFAEVLDRASQGDIVDFEHAQRVLGREIDQRPRLLRRLGQRVRSRRPFVVAEHGQHREEQ